MIQSKKQTNIREYIQVAFRRKWLFIVPVVVMLLAAVIAAQMMPEIYEASTLVLTEDEQIVKPIIKDMAVSASFSERLGTLREAILSWSRLVEVVRELKLDRDVKTQVEFEKLIMNLRENISVEMQGKDVISISYKGENPSDVQNIANTITEVFISRHLELREEEAVLAIGFIEDELKTYLGKVEGMYGELRQFREKNLLATPGQISITLDRLISFDSELIDIDLKLKEAYKKKNMLAKQLSEQEKIIVSEERLQQNPVIAKLNERLVSLETTLATLLVDATEDHPTVKELRREIKDLTRRVEEEEMKTLVSYQTTTINPTYKSLEEKTGEMDVQITALESRKKEIETLKQRYTEIAKSLPEKEEELTLLTMNKDVYESLHTNLLDVLEKALMSKRLENMTKRRQFNIIDRARYPLKPVSPDKMKIALLGLVLGAMTGSGLIWFAEYADHSFVGIEDAKAFLSIPYLGAISRMISRPHKFEVKEKKDTSKGKKKNKETPPPLVYVTKKKDDSGIAPQMVAYYDTKSVVAEQYRIVRTKIENIHEKSPKSIVFTSVTHQEGKSITSANIASVMAQDLDKKVLLIDCDMRRGTIHHLMGLKHKPGLSELLQSDMDFTRFVQENKILNLDVITCGDKPNNPSELLGSHRMNELLEAAKKKYDYVILDAPPVLPVTDAEVLANKVDGVVFVIRTAKTQRETVLHAQAQLGQSNANIIGFVLTFVEYYMPYSLYRYLQYPTNYYY